MVHALLSRQDATLLNRSIDSLLQHTGKHHQAAIILSENIAMGWGGLLCDQSKTVREQCIHVGI